MNKPDQDALDRMAKARVSLLIDQPFFGTLAMRLKMIEDRSLKPATLNVDGSVMRYHPDFVKSLSNDVLKAAVGHEVMHCALDHVGSTGRGINLNPKKWNYAADFVVNDILKKSGFTLGDNWLHDPQYAGMTAEQVYSLLPDIPDDGNGNGGPQDQVVPGVQDPAMAQAQAADWKVATVQAANAAKAVGKLPQELERFIDQLMENKVDWKAELRRFIQQAAKNDYAWQRPNRKMLAAGYYLPGLYSETCGQIAIYVDESMSIGDEELTAFSGEILAIQQDLRPEKIVLGHFDTRVSKVEEFTPDDPFKLVRYAGGGTDFRPPIQHAMDMPTPPLCAIVLTDLFGPFHEHPPEFPVIWVSINEQKAPWGETIHLEV